MVASLTKNEHGIYLAMEPDLIQTLITQLAEHPSLIMSSSWVKLQKTPLICRAMLLISPVYRMAISHLSCGS